MARVRGASGAGDAATVLGMRGAEFVRERAAAAKGSPAHCALAPQAMATRPKQLASSQSTAAKPEPRHIPELQADFASVRRRGSNVLTQGKCPYHLNLYTT